MEKQDIIKKGEDYFAKAHKQERLMGTLVLIIMTIAPIIILPLTMTIVYTIFCILIYLKFLHDIKKKWNKLMTKFNDAVNQPLTK